MMVTGETSHAGAREDQVRESARAIAAMDKATAEAEQARVEVRQAKAAWDKIAKRLPRETMKSGRPSIWRGLYGYTLVKAVAQIRRGKPGRSIAQAIRLAVKNDRLLNDPRMPKPKGKLADRALQARYQEAADYFAYTLDKERYARLRAPLNAALARLRAALDREHEAMVFIDRLLDRRGGNPYRPRS